MPQRGGRDGRDRALRVRRDQRLMLRAIDRAHSNYTWARVFYASWLRRQANDRPLRPRSVPDCREFQRFDERLHDQKQIKLQVLATVGQVVLVCLGELRNVWLLQLELILLWDYDALLCCVGITHKTVLRIPREKDLRPYKVKVVHELRPGDRTARLRFYRWIIFCKIWRYRHFVKHIVFTDESSFPSTSILNRQNDAIRTQWSKELSRAIF